MLVSSAWPLGTEAVPAVAVLDKAIRSGRLCHGLLLLGEDASLLQGVAHTVADRLLNVPASSARFSPSQHPDCFFLRPTGKMRQIGAEPTRELILKLQVSPAVSPRKVAIVVDADRMNTAAANIFLKTLEEPPRETTILLLTTRPHALLPTIRSRVQNFRFPSSTDLVSAAGWPDWIADYQAWLAHLASNRLTKKGSAGPVMRLYGLIARFSHVLELATAQAWASQKEKLPAELSDEEQAAIESGLAHGLRARLFADIERATRGFAMPQIAAGDEALRQPLIATVEALEGVMGLLALNMNEGAVMEDFLLATLRIWTRR
jgi:DNA polymerase III subunit delta'